jgi:Uma2 family endonuclease
MIDHPEAVAPTTSEPFAVKTLYTIADFDEIRAMPDNEDRLLELIHGEITEKMPNEMHGEIAAWIASVLTQFVYPRKLGRVGVEVSHRPIIGQYNDRMPDVSFRAAGQPLVTHGSVPGMPDLAVEIKSPRNSFESLREKAQFYLQNGSRMVWLVHPMQRQIELCVPSKEARATMIVRLLNVEDTLDGGEVLPGFSVKVSELFPLPLKNRKRTRPK